MEHAIWFDDDGIDLNVVLNMAEQLAHPMDLEIVQQQAQVTRNENYFEVTVQGYSDEQFKDHFRMRRPTFLNLCEVISQHMVERQAKVELQKKVLLTVSILAKPMTFLEAGDKFGLSSGTAHYVFKEVVGILSQLVNTYVVWPQQLQVNAATFQERSHGFPNVVGIIDGCHIPIKQPVGNANDFYNRHEVHSIILQGVCDHNLKFIDLFIGLPGRMHDARVFRNSPLFQNLTNNILPQRYYLLGDTAYPLLPYLLTPYRDNGHLNDVKINFNMKLSSIRSTIERAFGLLKGKFRRLKYLDIDDLELGNNIIAAACVLHNFLIDQGDIDINLVNENEINGVVEHQQGNFGAGNREQGQRKRDTIAAMIN